MGHRMAGLLLAVGLMIGALPARAGMEPEGDRVLKDFMAAYEQADSFKGKVSIWVRRGKETSTMRVDMALQKPNKTGFTILEAPQNRGAEGTRMTWFGRGQQVNVKTRFFGIPLTLSVSPNDDRIKDLRGNTMEDTNIVRAVELLRQPDTELRYLGSKTYLERPMQLIEMRSPRLLKGIDREVVWLDEKTKLPFVREMYADGDLVYRLTVETFQFNGTLPANAFKLD